MPRSQWVAVIKDSYDGNIDGHYSCAAVAAAIERIPNDKIDCGPCLALATYEKQVC